MRDAAYATRDTTKDINYTAREVRDSHIIADTASAVRKQLSSSETLPRIEDTARQLPRAAPRTADLRKRSKEKDQVGRQQQSSLSKTTKRARTSRIKKKEQRR